ncbi:kinesin-like protein KIF6 isoform X2 [Denticeps clupeoides]|uniref:Kinesin-like protein n=1 Tax=Denticeps clupeoides TaxID=299321 RepID=A0AAY4AH58_9TELE|nr:kinesin-like protein KIF6 isoform X2 [Denticeps clupeoides]
MVKQTIQIFARVKPTTKGGAVYSVEDDGSCLGFVVPKDLADGFINNKRESYKFRFQKIFDQSAKQEELFDTVAKPVADSVLAGYNGTIFAYGQTASGKTFTITGGAERYSDRGIIPRTLSYLYQHFSQDSTMAYTIHISYLEIYNEMGFDLLDPKHEASRLEDLPRVTILEDPDQNIHLKNLSLQQAGNEKEALNLLFLGDTNRMIAETPMNQASTRSHCIFTIHLCGREPGSATLRRSKLHLVDLAGSERVGRTGAGGQHFTESKYINLSLHFLEQVIIALSEKSRSHIPYRNSMMTSVLRDSLGGNCMTTMIATVSAEKRNVDESISTCRFAQRVALIKNEAWLNEELDPALLIARLKKEVQLLKGELAMVTGEQRSEKLSPQEIQRLGEQLKVYLDDSDSEAMLDVGPDMRKICHCFSELKTMVCKATPASFTAGDTSAITLVKDIPTPEEVKKLKDMLVQRDNEISILVSMLKKEKKRVQDAVSTAGNMEAQSSLQSSTANLSDESLKGSEDLSPLPRLLQRKKGLELSVGRQEAFEIFKRDHKDQLTIEDNKALLKLRYTEAKALGEKVNSARNKVNDLKKQLELRRRQIAAQGVMGNLPESEVPDPMEEKLLAQIEEEKNMYKNTFGKLKGMKTEIEHLQLLLEKQKFKLQKDFEDWWTHEAGSMQRSVPEETSAAPTRTPTLSRPMAIRDTVSTRMIKKEHELSASPLLNLRESGLHPQVDADLLAFIKARQNILNKIAELPENFCR